MQLAEGFSGQEMLPWVNKLGQSIIQARGHAFFQQSIQELSRMLAYMQH
ncbi:MAG: hypothetical protein ACLFOA_09620 [Desulfohalobiaceae bacterium]